MILPGAEASFSYYWRGCEPKASVLRLLERDQLQNADWLVASHLNPDEYNEMHTLFEERALNLQLISEAGNAWVFTIQD
jgi:hypothetical protein